MTRAGNRGSGTFLVLGGGCLLAATLATSAALWGRPAARWLKHRLVRPDPRPLVEGFFQTRILNSVRDVRLSVDESGGFLVWRCTAPELAEILTNSPYLPHDLVPAAPPPKAPAGAPRWWRPERLIEPREGRSEWEDGAFAVACAARAGRDGADGLTTCYVRVALLDKRGAGGAALRRRLTDVFQAALPPSATNLCDWSSHLLIPVRKGTFQCASAELDDFLRRSPVLPCALAAGADVRFMNCVLDWWRPEALRDARSGRSEWQTAAGRTVCLLRAGQEPETPLVRVYYQLEEWPASLSPEPPPPR